MKQDTPITSIVQCLKLMITVSLDVLYQQFQNMTNKQFQWITLLPHRLWLPYYSRNHLPFRNQKCDQCYKRPHTKCKHYSQNWYTNKVVCVLCWRL